MIYNTTCVDSYDNITDYLCQEESWCYKKCPNSTFPNSQNICEITENKIYINESMINSFFMKVKTQQKNN